MSVIISLRSVSRIERQNQLISLTRFQLICCLLHHSSLSLYHVFSSQVSEYRQVSALNTASLISSSLLSVHLISEHQTTSSFLLRQCIRQVLRQCQCIQSASIRQLLRQRIRQLLRLSVHSISVYQTSSSSVHQTSLLESAIIRQVFSSQQSSDKFSRVSNHQTSSLKSAIRSSNTVSATSFYISAK
jgi:hypothetical protein